MGSNPTLRTRIEPYASEDFVNFVLWLRKKRVRGRRISESTVESKVKIIKQLMKKVNLWDKDTVKGFIEESDWSDGRKNNVLYAYQDWCRFKGFDFKSAS